MYITIALSITGCAGKQLDLLSLFQQTQMKLVYNKADKLLENDEPVAAAELLWAYTTKLPSPYRQEMQIRAAEILLDHNHPLGAYRYLTQIDETVINDEVLLRKRIADARFYDESRQYNKVLTSLPESLTVDADKTSKISALQLIATALPYANELVKSITTRLELNQLFDKEQRTENILSLWQLVTTIDPYTARRELEAEQPEAIIPWLELALLATPEEISIPQLESDLQTWRTQNSRWELPELVYQELLGRWEYLNFTPQQVAVLLPLTGQYSKYGKTVRDGLIFAHDNQEQSELTLQFLNTDTKESTTTLYQTAVANGAEFIIGPLLKERVEELLDTANFEVPVMTLNYATTRPTYQQREFFQFGLLPEDEATQVAQKIWGEEHRFAVVLTPNNAWGERLSDAFVEQYLELGGNIRQIVRYDTSLVDYTSIIENAFQLTQSRDRQRQLNQTIGYKPEFTPRIRNDVDVAVLFADSQHAAMLYPQMKYHYVDKLPVYATSHVYTPTLTATNRDLDGLIYCDAPAVINYRHDVFGDKAKNPQFRLFTLGVDSYRLIREFRRMSIAHISYQGLTGDLSINRDGRLFRELRWAEFRHGKPEALIQLQ